MRQKIFFGWYVASIGFLALLCSYGIRYSFGVFFPPMLKDLHWSRTLLSGALSLSMIVNAVMAPVFGVLVDRYGPRWLITLGAAVVGLSLMVISQFSQIWHLYLVYGIILAVGINGMGLVVNNTMCTNWFVKKRGIALALTTAGTGLGTFIFSPMCNQLIASYGWRMSFFILGIGTMVVIIPLAQFFARKRPEEMGLLPDGDEPAAASASNINAGQPDKASAAPKPEIMVTVPEGLRSSNFWLIFIGYLLYAAVGFVMLTHLVAYAVEIGVSSVNAALALGLTGGVAVGARFIWGYMGDKLKNRKIALVGGLACYVIAFAVLALAKNTGTLYVFAVIYGLGSGGLALLPALVGDQFGRLAMGKLYGLLSFGGAVGAAIGPVLGGRIYDVTHSYTLAWQVCVGIASAALICFALLGKSVLLAKIQMQQRAAMK